MTVLTITTDYDVYADNVNVKEPSDTSLYFGPAGKGGPYRTAIRFPLNNLPSGLTEADIQQVRLYLYCRTASGAAHLTDVHAYNTNGQTDPASDDAPTIYSRAGSGNLYNDDLTEFRTTGDKWIVLGGSIKADILAAKSAVNRFSFGIHEEGDNDETPNVDSRENPSGFAPKLEIIYGAPPPAYIPVMKFHQKGTTTIYTSG